MMKFKFIVTLAVLFSSICVPGVFALSKKTPFYEIKVYHFENANQEDLIDDYLKNAFLPAMNRNGIMNVGVFKPVNNNSSEDKRIYVLVPFKSTKQFTEMPEQLAKDATYNENGKAYLEASYNKSPYKRMESIFIKAFSQMPSMELPALKNELSERIYELRSYEGPTEKMHLRKVEMFNTGGEISLFKRLGFNAVFYGSVIAGSRMPNLMYMTTFENMAARDEHWNAFKVDAEWKKLSAMEYYKNTVSKNDTLLLTPAKYSQI